MLPSRDSGLFALLEWLGAHERRAFLCSARSGQGALAGPAFNPNPNPNPIPHCNLSVARELGTYNIQRYVSGSYHTVNRPDTDRRLFALRGK